MARQTRVVRFAAFEVNLETGELRRDGRRIPLQRQPFNLLAVLLERPGDLVTQQTLRRTLWAEGTHVSFERGLASALRKVRDALGDTARTPRFIETLPRRGYRFIAPVTSEVREETPEPRTRPEPARARGWKLRWAAGLILGAVVIGQGSFPARTDDRVSAAASLSAFACELKSRGEMTAALKVIRQAHALAPASAKIMAEVGFYLHAAGYYDEEFPALRRALDLDAASPDAWLHMGLAQARRDDFPGAIASLERARLLSGGSDQIERWLTWARGQERSRRAA